MTPNAQQLQGQWNEIKGQLRQKWGQLTDDDIELRGGNVDEVIGRIQRKTGEGREAVERYLTELTEKGASKISGAAQAARDYLDTAGERLRDGYGDVADKARDGISEAERMVRSNPVTALCSAFGCGVVLGLAIGMSTRSR